MNLTPRLPNGRFPARLFTRLPFAAMLAASTAVSTANAGTPNLEKVATIGWPAAFGTVGSFTRMVAGDLTGDGFPDAVGLSGTRAIFFEDIGIHTELSEIPLQANDVAVAPIAAPTGHDALAVVNASGLQLVYLVHSVPPGDDQFVSSLVVANEWAGALKVRSADLNASGVADYVGVAADGKTLLCRRDGQAQTSRTLTRTVLDLHIVRWNAGGPPRIAVLTTAGVFIYDADWNVVEGFGPAGVPGGVIGVLPDPMANRLVWVVEQPSGGQQIFTLAANGSIVPGALISSSTHVVAVAAADIDGDGHSDLVLSHQRDCLPLFCDGANDFLADPVPLLDDAALAGASGANNKALPLVADLDLDGYADVVVAAQPLESYSVFLRASTVNPQVSGFFQEDSTFHFNPDPLSRTLRIAFEFESFPVTATHVEMVVWKQINGPTGPVLDASFDHRVYTPVTPMDGNVRACEAIYDKESGDDGSCFPSIYWIELRPVKLSNGEAFAVGPDNIAALASDPGWVADILTWGGVLHHMWETPKCPPDDPLPVAGQRAPGVVSWKRLPDFEHPGVHPPKALDLGHVQPVLEFIYGDFP